MRPVAIGAALLAIGAAAAATIGQVGRDTVPVLDTLPPWAGGRPDVAACERAIGTTLTAPATYRRVAIVSGDSEVLTPAQFDREAGIEPLPRPRRGRKGDALDATLAERDKLDAAMAQIERQRAEGHKLRLRRMVIDYDADNAAGVPIRAKGVCLFRLTDGQLDSTNALKLRADRVGSDAAMASALSYLGREPRQRRSRGGCCL